MLDLKIIEAAWEYFDQQEAPSPPCIEKLKNIYFKHLLGILCG